MKLYFNKNSRATRPRWLLEELGVPYEIVPIDMAAREHKSEAHLKVHPLGKLPALQLDDGTPVFESAAICLYLADSYPDKGLLAPVGAPARALAMQWTVYASVTLEGPVAEYAGLRRKPEGERDEAAMAEQRTKFATYAAPLAAALDGRDWLVGDFSVADVMIGSVLAWARSLGLLDDSPILHAYATRCMQRPAFSAARA